MAEADTVDTTELPPLVDVGVNCANRSYNLQLVDAMLKDAAAANVVGVVAISNSIRECYANLHIAQRHPTAVRTTVGVHPHNARLVASDTAKMCGKLHRMLTEHPSVCVAVGECGLDYNRMHSSREEQLAVFEAQIQVAKAAGKPLYLHCRNAFADFVAALHRGGYCAGVVHCFTGNAEEAATLAGMGLYMGVTGWLFDEHRNAALLSALTSGALPLCRLVVETDAPFMPLDAAPRSSSSPKDVQAIVGRLAHCLGVSASVVAAATLHNTRTLFGAFH